jgi:hypothetical protein
MVIYIKTATLVAFLLLTAATKGFTQNKNFKVFLVGDAGEDTQTGETLKSLHRQLIDNPNSAVVFLGDNAYKSILWGIIPFGFKGFDGSRLSQKKVRSQLDILTGYKGHVYFVPGNHDWWNIKSLDRGKRKLQMEQTFIEQNLDTNTSIANPHRLFLPTGGAPGPDFADLDHGSVRIIFIDTYRLIMEGFKKNDREDTVMENNFSHSFDSLLRESRLHHQKIVIACHHPVVARGPNTGPLRNPLLFKRIKASNIRFRSYGRMITALRIILTKYPGVYYASGHMHALQYFLPSDSIHYIISGAGSKVDHVRAKAIRQMTPANSNEYELWNINGFFGLEFAESSEKVFLYYDNGHQQCELQ